MICIILDSETLPRRELKYAEELAGALGLNYQVVKSSLLTDDEFLKNPSDRCYFCKKSS